MPPISPRSLPAEDRPTSSTLGAPSRTSAPPSSHASSSAPFDPLFADPFTPRTSYAHRKAIREATSLQMMMHMDAATVRAIQSQFAALGGRIDIYDFVNIMQGHLPEYSQQSAGPGALGKAGGGSMQQQQQQQQQQGADGRMQPRRTNVEGLVGGGTPTSPGVTAPNTPTVKMPNLLLAGHQKKSEEVVADLVELFREVDINGDGHMEWDEFTRFIVEKASLFQDQMSLDKIPPYFHNTRLNSENIEVSQRQRHVDTIDKVVPLHKSNQFAVIEAHSKYVSLYNSLNGTLVHNLKQNAAPLALCHVESQNCLAASCADMTVNVWNLDDPSAKRRYTLRSKWPTKHAMMSLCWVEAHKLLYTGSTIGSIGAWSLADREEKGRFEGHSDIVMEMISMHGLNNVVSASLDTSLRIWDTYTEQETHKLVGHTKGVFSLTYNPEHRFIVSAGFDHDAYVWSPFVNTLLFKLSGHTSSLVKCECVEGTQELITADISGLFKIWDLRNFQCCQTFTSVHEAGDLNDLNGLSSFAHVKLPAHGGDPDFYNPEDSKEDYRIICGTKRIFYFDQFRAQNEPLTDTLPITVALFNSVSLTIFTAAGRHAKVWDAVMGNLKMDYKDLSTSDISAACLDDRQRKFIIGDVQGTISVFNYSNGALMKKFPPFEEGAAVVDLIYCSHAKVVLAAASNGNIRIYDELDPENCVVLREFDQGYIHPSLSTIKYCQSARTVISAGMDFKMQIKMWDFETGKCIFEFAGLEQEDEEFAASMAAASDDDSERGQHNVPKSSDDGESITAMCCLEPYPLIACSSTDGKISIYGMRHAHPRIKHSCILRFNNRPPVVATYDGENEQEYPLLQMPKVRLQSAEGRTRLSSVDAGSVSHKVVLRRRSSEAHISAQECSDPNWVTKPRFGSPRAAMPLVSHSIKFDPDEECMYTGDESGRIRKWGLSKLFQELTSLGLVEKGKVRSEPVAPYGSERAQAQSVSRSRSSMGKKEFQNYLPSPTFSPTEFIEFRWGVEAHEDSVSLDLVTEGTCKAILSYSVDRTVKMWTSEGRPMGILLAGLEPGTKNPAWDFKLSAETRQKRDDVDAENVMAQLKMDKLAAHGVVSVDAEGHVHERRAGLPGTPVTAAAANGREKAGGRDSSKKNKSPVAGAAIRSVQKLRETMDLHSRHEGLITEDIIELKEKKAAKTDAENKHLRVLEVLSDMQTMAAAHKPLENGDNLSESIADLEVSLAKAGRQQPIRVPKGFKMSSMNKVEALGFTLTGPGTEKGSKFMERSSGEQTSPGDGDGKGSSGRLPTLPQTFRKFPLPPSIVPPSPGRKTQLDPKAAASHVRIVKEKESLTGSMIGSNPFDGDSVSLEEFAKHGLGDIGARLLGKKSATDPEVPDSESIGSF